METGACFFADNSLVGLILLLDFIAEKQALLNEAHGLVCHVLLEYWPDAG